MGTRQATRSRIPARPTSAGRLDRSVTSPQPRRPRQATARRTLEAVRAEMMRPYADRVFLFLVGYCLFVALLILLEGFRVGEFDIADGVLGVIAGSTAVAAIGLVGFVVSGLFGSGPDHGSARGKADP